MSVELRRIQSDIFKKKPEVILENKFFKNLKNLPLGSRGQLDAILRVVNIEDVMDENMTQRREFDLKFESIKEIDINSNKEFK